MGSTLIQIASDAYQMSNVDQSLTSFSQNQEFPYNIALVIFNYVINEMNRVGNYWFCETQQALTYSAGVATYNLDTIAAEPISPHRIIRLRRELIGFEDELNEVNYRDFQSRWRTTTINTQMPTGWAKYLNILYLNYIPDQDYSLKVYYYTDIPSIDTGDENLTGPVPIAHEDILREGIYAYLLERTGDPKAMGAMGIYQNKLNALVGMTGQDAGMATQFPAVF